MMLSFERLKDVISSSKMMKDQDVDDLIKLVSAIIENSASGKDADVIEYRELIFNINLKQLSPEMWNRLMLGILELTDEYNCRLLPKFAMYLIDLVLCKELDHVLAGVSNNQICLFDDISNYANNITFETFFDKFYQYDPVINEMDGYFMPNDRRVIVNFFKSKKRWQLLTTMPYQSYFCRGHILPGEEEASIIVAIIKMAYFSNSECEAEKKVRSHIAKIIDMMNYAALLELR